MKSVGLLLVSFLWLGLIIGCQLGTSSSAIPPNDTSPSETVSLGSQSGAITSGTAGTATYSVTTTNIATGTSGTVTWYSSSAGTTIITIPAGISPLVANLTSNAATITMTTTTSAGAGVYYFKVSYSSVTSPIATLTVAAPGQTETANLASQTGKIKVGIGGTATFTATTANVVSGTSGTVTWYSSFAGRACLLFLQESPRRYRTLLAMWPL